MNADEKWQIAGAFATALRSGFVADRVLTTSIMDYVLEFSERFYLTGVFGAFLLFHYRYIRLEYGSQLYDIGM
jgi:hypothetical protein